MECRTRERQMELRNDATQDEGGGDFDPCQFLNYRVMDEHKAHAACSGLDHVAVP
jgi:hypothetical protein